MNIQNWLDECGILEDEWNRDLCSNRTNNNLINRQLVESELEPQSLYAFHMRSHEEKIIYLKGSTFSVRREVIVEPGKCYVLICARSEIVRLKCVPSKWIIRESGTVSGNNTAFVRVITLMSNDEDNLFTIPLRINRPVTLILQNNSFARVLTFPSVHSITPQDFDVSYNPKTVKQTTLDHRSKPYEALEIEARLTDKKDPKEVAKSVYVSFVASKSMDKMSPEKSKRKRTIPSGAREEATDKDAVLGPTPPKMLKVKEPYTWLESDDEEQFTVKPLPLKRATKKRTQKKLETESQESTDKESELKFLLEQPTAPKMLKVKEPYTWLESDDEEPSTVKPLPLESATKKRKQKTKKQPTATKKRKMKFRYTSPESLEQQITVPLLPLESEKKKLKKYQEEEDKASELRSLLQRDISSRSSGTSILKRSKPSSPTFSQEIKTDPKTDREAEVIPEIHPLLLRGLFTMDADTFEAFFPAPIRERGSDQTTRGLYSENYIPPVEPIETFEYVDIHSNAFDENTQDLQEMDEYLEGRRQTPPKPRKE